MLYHGNKSTKVVARNSDSISKPMWYHEDTFVFLQTALATAGQFDNCNESFILRQAWGL